MEWMWVVVAATVLVVATKWYSSASKGSSEVKKYHLGDITAQTLRQYCGYDFMKPILLAIKGKVYDVTKAADQFMPGKPLHVYAGKEVSRALALASTAETDCESDVLHDLSPEALERLTAAIEEYEKKYDVVGQVVPLKEMTLEQLAQHDGVAQPGARLYLAVQGTVFDVSKAPMFYGPDGAYPFAGKECARALALMSTDLADCNDNVDDLQYVEKENLKEWVGKFTYKYPIVAKIVPSS